MAVETKNRYTEAVGRRKTAIARVRLTPGAKTTFKINNRGLEDYFPVKEHQSIIEKPFKTAGVSAGFNVSIVVKGGGVHAQAESIAMGLSRVLAKMTPDLRLPLKRAGHLARDARAKERRKFGLKKARKSPQWSKR
jgi:small subunit ribosomal protein S9